MTFPILSEEQLRKLEVVDVHVCKKGRVIVVRGEVTGAVCLLDRGAAAADYKTGRVSASVALGPGDFFGEHCLSDAATSPATVRATADGTIVLAVARDSFTRLLESEPELKTRFEQCLAERRERLQTPQPRP